MARKARQTGSFPPPPPAPVKPKPTVGQRIEKFLLPATTDLMSERPNDGPFMGIAMFFQLMMLPWALFADFARACLFVAVIVLVCFACYGGAHFLHWV